MESLYLLIPLSAGLVLLILAVFGWALHGGQFEELEAEGGRILRAEGPAPAVALDDDQAAAAVQAQESSVSAAPSPKPTPPMPVSVNTSTGEVRWPQQH